MQEVKLYAVNPTVIMVTSLLSSVGPSGLSQSRQSRQASAGSLAKLSSETQPVLSILT